jgi:hypothetical protein
MSIINWKGRKRKWSWLTLEYVLLSWHLPGEAGNLRKILEGVTGLRAEI